jgi:hypothetical protein
MSQKYKLTKEEVRWCADMALNRWLIKWGSEDNPTYRNDSYKEPELMNNIRSIVSEFAVAELWQLPHVSPFYENKQHYFRKDIPDVLPNLEVRTFRSIDAIPVKDKDKRDGLIIVGTHIANRHYFDEVEVFGWIKVEDCFRDEWWSKQEGLWRVPLNELNDSNPFA